MTRAIIKSLIIMSWSDFTKENVKQFSKAKIHIGNANPLLTEIKNERKKIKDFIKALTEAPTVPATPPLVTDSVTLGVN